MQLRSFASDEKVWNPPEGKMWNVIILNLKNDNTTVNRLFRKSSSVK
jgi:hypothetical protein